MKTFTGILLLSALSFAAEAGNRFTPGEQAQMERGLARQLCRESGRCFPARESRAKSTAKGNRFSPSEQERMERALDR